MVVEKLKDEVIFLSFILKMIHQTYRYYFRINHSFLKQLKAGFLKSFTEMILLICYFRPPVVYRWFHY
jgi:hypothetical protein